MNHSLEDIGVLTVVLDSFGKRTLPRIFDIKKIIDDGGTLSDSHIDFLDEALNQALQYGNYVDEHPAFRDLFSRVAHLYHEITSQALENEQHIPDNISQPMTASNRTGTL